MSSTPDKDVLAFWNDRAKLGGLAGTNDFVLKQIEMRFLGEFVPAKSSVLDVGSGVGESLAMLVRDRGCTGVGLDFSPDMVAAATANAAKIGLGDRLRFAAHRLPEAPTAFGQFDVVISQRCLINLRDPKDQAEAMGNMRHAVKPGGLCVMLEATMDGLNRTNELRASLGLELMTVPWHNRFLALDEMRAAQTPDFRIEAVRHISSTYMFLSRGVYARLAADAGEDLRYDSPINLLSTKLPLELGDYGPVKAVVWRKS